MIHIRMIKKRKVRRTKKRKRGRLAGVIYKEKKYGEHFVHLI